METILGIDLGTTNSAVSVIEGNLPRVLTENGQALLPSIVGLDAAGQLLIGQPALNQWGLAPDRTVRSIKRKMGSDEQVQLGDRCYSPPELSAMILRELKQRAARELGREVTKAVITVPAFFNERQREATRSAGELAGLDVVRIVNEPTAAALTYNSQSAACERVLVYDLGGGTFDVSIVQIEAGVIEVLASHGDTQLGGDDFDQLLLDHVCDAFQQQHEIDLRKSLASRSRVLRAVEEAKKQLSFEPFVKIEEEFIAEQKGAAKHLTMELSRHEYEPLIEPLLEKTLVCVAETLADAKLTAEQIDRVILVGGASRTPRIHQMLTEQLQQPIHSEVDPDLCVTLGAAVQGGLVAGLDLGPVLVDITPHTLGVSYLGELYGYASEHCFMPLIRRNTALPATRSEVFVTAVDGQQQVLVSVSQGENKDARQNKKIGEFLLEGLSEVDAGNQILARFDLDLDGILTVTVSERSTGLAEALTIDNALDSQLKREFETSRQRVDDAFQTVEHQIGAELNESDVEQPATSSPADANSPAAASSPAEQDASMSPELQTALDQANQLLSKADDLTVAAESRDADELRELADRLRQAVQDRDLSELEAGISALDDLVFYLQDA